MILKYLETDEGIIMGQKRSSVVDVLFNNKGEIKQKTPLSPFFTRKPYQYTTAEPKETDRGKLFGKG